MRYASGFILVNEEKLDKLIENIGQLIYFSDIGEYKANALRLKGTIKPLMTELKG